MGSMRRLRQLVTPCVFAVLPVIAACSPSKGEGPEWSPIEDQQAFVGSQFTLHLEASDPEGDRLTFSFQSSVPDLDQRAEIRPRGESSAEFVWTPRANDEGVQVIDFIVSDGSSSATESVAIDVRASEGAGSPIFRKPLGTGSTLDLDSRECLDLDLLVQDDDSTEVTFDQGETPIDGAELDQRGPFEGTWQWCPTPDQISAQQNYLLALGADDGENPRTQKRYAIYLYRAPRPGCPGDAPVIVHEPEHVTSVQSLVISARITDDHGIKGDPVVHWTISPPGTPISLGDLQPVPMLLIDDVNGDWAAELPNPVAAAPAGTTATIYYVITATDTDDDVQDCNHIAMAPAVGAYEMIVTSGGVGSPELCKACSADASCGDEDDNCIQVSGTFSCSRSCASDSDCPSDYRCSTTALTSIDGAVARQCFPRDFNCDPEPVVTCEDDAFEDNDTRSLAATKPALPPGTHQLVSCPRGADDDEDWFKIEVAQESRVQLTLVGTDADDLDLALVSSTGSVLAASQGISANESIDTCVQPGNAFIHVWAAGQAARNPYSLTYTLTTGCAGVCTADAMEPDSSAADANIVSAQAIGGTGYKKSGSICPQNEDWFKVTLSAGQTLYSSLKFTQTGSGTDLDFNFYKGTTDLFPCNETNFGMCADAYGQGSNSNENFAYTATSAGDYYLVVRGFEGARNTYDLCMSLEQADCPVLP